MIWLMLTVLGIGFTALVLSHLDQSREIYQLRTKVLALEGTFSRKPKEVHIHHYPEKVPKGLGAHAMIPRGLDA